jgi:hypothetical protein
MFSGGVVAIAATLRDWRHNHSLQHNMLAGHAGHACQASGGTMFQAPATRHYYIKVPL